MAQRVTIVTVAEACGVTDGTVSRALRGDPRVRPETRAKVLAAAEKLGYRPNLGARALKQGRSGLLGVLCDSGPWMISNGYFGQLLAGLAEAAAEDQSRLLLYLPRVRTRSHNPSDDLVELSGLDALCDGRVDAGVILGGRPPLAADLARLKRRSVPLVWLSPNQAMPGVSQVLSGAYERALQAGRVLARHGHRSIGFAGLFKAGDHEAVSQKGLLEGLGPGGNVQAAAMDHWDLTDPERVAPMLKRLLAAKPTALLVSSADQALVIQDLLGAQGIRVPQDLSLLSFGPRPSAGRARPAQLSLLHADLPAAGAAAYALVKEGLAGRDPRNVTMAWSQDADGETLRDLRS